MSFPILPDFERLLIASSAGPLKVERFSARTLSDLGDTGSIGSTSNPAGSFILDPVAVLPLDKKKHDNLPEAVRTGKTIEIYCRQALRTAEEGADADVITYPKGSGKRHRIYASEDYEYQGGVFFFFGVLMEKGKGY